MKEGTGAGGIESPGPEKKNAAGFGIPLAGATLAGFAALFAMSAGIGSRLGFWHFTTGFTMLRWAAVAAILGVIVCISGLVFSRRPLAFRLIVGGSGILIGTVVFLLLLRMWIAARSVPPIHDITTDISNPPQFYLLLEQRKRSPNSSDYGGPEVAVRQLQAYPDINSVVLNFPQDQAFSRSLEAVRRIGWDIAGSNPREGRIEATATSFWFGFKDDIVIRVAPAGNRSIIDVRSSSRVGRSDLGMNARHIREFFRQLRRGH
jgi:hypothetical protein